MVALSHNLYAESHHSILLVEDERISRRALTTLLRCSGYDPEAVGSAEEALSLIATGVHPEIALVDLDLPGMSGLQLIDLLSHCRPAIPAILITASSKERLHQLLKKNRIQYMRKPIDFNRLLCLLTPSPADS